MLAVANKFPTKATARRIAIVGEAPGTSEVHWHTCNKCGYAFATQWRDQGGWHTTDRCNACFSTDIKPTPEPFRGPSGFLLGRMLAQVGIDREACFVGNCCQVQPPGNDISRFKWDGEEMTAGLEQLRVDLAAFEPHFCLLLGNTPLRAFSSDRKRNIGDWRGSLFMSSFLVVTCTNCSGNGEVGGYPCMDCNGDAIVGEQVKCLASYHPAALLREAGLTGVARFDFARAAEERRVDGLVVAEDSIYVDWGCETLVLALALIRDNKERVAVDIEGGCGGVSCIGFATSGNHAFVVPFIRADGTSYWDDPEDEVRLWEAVAAVLEDDQVPKVLQNYLYDAFVLAWSYGILIRGLADDIMLKHFELYAEFEKSLGFQTSIYTKHPFYKFERKSDDERVQLTYCGKDCCRTFECCEAQEKQLMPKQREHYEQNVKLLAPILYMELRGIRFDVDAAQARLYATQKRIYALQDRINREAAGSRPPLRHFYAAVGGLCGLPENDAEAAKLAQVSGGSVSQCDARRGTSGELVAILAEAFCRKDPGEQREVEERYYEPQRWNGKRWVKGGKRLLAGQAKVAEADASQAAGAAKALQGRAGVCSQLATVEAWLKAGAWQGSQGPTLQPGDKGATWLKPGSKRVTKRCSVAIETFEDVRRFAKDSCKQDCRQALAILQSVRDGHSSLLPHQRGELATLLGIHVKINSTGEGGDAQWFLYDHCKLPRQYQKDGNKLTDRLASDDEAIIKAWVKVKDRRALWFLNLRQLVTSTKSLSAVPDADGRIRCGYNLVGAETHRLTCYGSPTGSSDLNLQTVTKGHRVLYRADDGCWMAQRDLSASDGYTVAAYAAMLGDTTLMEDNNAKLKPAQIMTLMMDGVQVNKMSREALKPLCKPITEESDWRYFAMKRVQHGGSYMMWKNTMSDQILTDSFKKSGKPIYVPPSKCEEMLVMCFFARYPGIQKWHAWMEREIKEKGELRSSDGFVRRFYGRKDDKATVKAALAHLPQYYTTRATMTALLKLWEDGENRREDGSLRIEPLHTVHDSLVTQFRKEDLEWARGRLDGYFQTPFLIAQTVLTIPASGTYGESWGSQEHAL